jgi:hypothetical protein
MTPKSSLLIKRIAAGIGVIITVVVLAGVLWIGWVLYFFELDLDADPEVEMLERAATDCDAERASELVAQVSDVDASSAWFGPPSVYLAAGSSAGQKAGADCPATIQVLFDAGATVDAEADFFWGSLFKRVADTQTDPDVVAKLVEIGADPCREIFYLQNNELGTSSTVSGYLKTVDRPPSIRKALRKAAADCA